MSPPLTPARRGWTVDEQKKLDDLLAAGKTAAEIATALELTPTSIYSRLQRHYRKQPKPGRPRHRRDRAQGEIKVKTA
jgi:IS30 family transposase